ncbi:hypothetical protein [Limnohabitans planktonicus]|uniref:hypothetical protein n=1 Tax=Limnohabitans planktonicus TaxID=540060 RepID=UPI000B149C72|nr:hypothetical protein [Limnohabitans planktonicus]
MHKTLIRIFVLATALHLTWILLLVFLAVLRLLLPWLLMALLIYLAWRVVAQA